MTSASTTTHTTTGALTGRLAAGIAGGLAGGMVFGMLMQMMNMIGMVAQLVGSTSTIVGWTVHLAISAFIGATYAVLFARWATRVVPAAVIGMAYGMVWWVMGALILMPAKLGMTSMILHVGTTQWQSLMGHLMYGAILGIVYALLRRRMARA